MNADETENKNKKKDIYGHLMYIGLLLLIVLVVFMKFLDGKNLPMLDHTTAYLIRVEILEKSLMKYQDLMPLWNPYLMSGTPLFAQAIFLSTDYLMGILVWLLGNSIAAIKTQYLLDVFLAGLFMYIFMCYLEKKKHVAFLTALVYMLGGYTFRYFMVGALTTMNTFPYVPLLFLFLMKALKEKSFRNAICLGIILAIQFRAGPDIKVMPWIGISMGLYACFYILGKNFKQRFIKVMIVGLIAGLIFLGLSMQRLLPIQEHVERTSRAALSFKESASRPLLLKDSFTRLVQPLKTFKEPRAFGTGEYIGIVAFLFVLYGLYRRYKNKNTIFFLTMFILGILLATGSFVYYFFWRYIPPFASFRYVERSLIVCFFALTVLAGIGISCFFELLEKKGYSKVKKNATTALTAGLIITNLTVFGYNQYDHSAIRDVDKLIGENKVIQYLSQQSGYFRFHVLETTGIDWGTEFYNIPYELELTYGYDVAWIQEYFNEYLGIAHQQPAKLWGILNVKYMTSMQPVEMPGFVLEKKVEACTYCPVEPLMKAHGPYIYMNTQFLPRVYSSNAWLLVGKYDAQKQALYSILLHQDFNTSKYFFVLGKERINDYSADGLSRYEVIVLTEGSIDQNSGSLLQTYKQNGGILWPDVLAGKNQIDEKEIKEALKKLGREPVIVPDENYVRKDFDHYELKLNKKYKGWLVLSERFAYFPGWKAYADGKEIPLHKANGVITALYLDGAYDKIEFEYLPKSFIIGTWITVTTIISLISYFAYSFVKARKVKHHEAVQA